MSQLSTDEGRYLQAACAASPEYGFRARIVGQRIPLTDFQTDAVVAALARAGMVEPSGGCDVQLTHLGREKARQLGEPTRQLKQRPGRSLLVYLAVGGGIAVTALSLLLWTAMR